MPLRGGPGRAGFPLAASRRRTAASVATWTDVVGSVCAGPRAPAGRGAPRRRPRSAGVLAVGLLLLLAAPAAGFDCPDGTEPRGAPPPEGRKQWCERPDGTQHGPSLTWFAGGAKRAEAHFRDGRLEGEYREWWPDGGLRERGRYEADQRTGTWTTWYESGQKRSEEGWKDGVHHGLSSLWYESGPKRAESWFREGERHGGARTWWENGRKQTEGQFVEGEYDGHWVGWYASGRKRKEATFDRGRELSREVYSDEGEDGAEGGG